MRRLAAAALLLSAATAGAEERYGFIQGERVEYRQSSQSLLWDLQGWYGSDYHKLWIKTEGTVANGSTQDAELQVLYSRASTAFFDLQLGIRYQDLAVGDLTSVVAGMQGVAPYRFEIDAALFLSEDGDISGRAEFERDYLFSEKLILQPRAEINIAFQDVPELAISSGVNELALELRLRYEITRKFAPYIGLSYERAYGGAARALNAAGESSSDTTLLVGMRFWF